MSQQNDYLKMQYNWYENRAKDWSLKNKNPVVGSYHKHNTWSDYDTYLFPKIDTSDMIALEYGCGPGRNLIKFNGQFKRIDGVDIGATNIENAKKNLNEADIPLPNLYVNDGKNIPAEDNTYDVVFSVICMQHIASYSIRDYIKRECYRVLKEGGYFCFQMGFGGRRGQKWVKYHDDAYDAEATNGFHDVSITDEKDLIDHLTKIGFTNIETHLRPTGPGDGHQNWIWVKCKK
jgi:SAM-dependent methyltransferase